MLLLNITVKKQLLIRKYITMKNNIADFFLADARDYLLRYEHLKSHATHLGLRSKLIVDLLFSLECSLKAIVFLDSTTPEKETYLKIKKLSHNINSLLLTLNPNRREKFAELITVDISIYKVYYRYLVESEIIFRSEIGTLDQTYYKSIADHHWMEKLADGIRQFIKYSEEINPHRMEIQNLADIDITSELEKQSALRDIIG